MIGYVQGTLKARLPGAFIVATPGGTGYLLRVSESTAAFFAEEGRDAELWVSTQVREDAIELFGFATLAERQCFELLIGIQGLGPKTALAMLTIFTPDELTALTVRGTPESLERVPGIGKKTAARIFMELSYLLKDQAKLAGLAAGEAAALPSGAGRVLADAVAGLTNLGYAEVEARSTAKDVLAEEPDLDVAGLVRACLKRLAKSQR